MLMGGSVRVVLYFASRLETPLPDGGIGDRVRRYLK